MCAISLNNSITLTKTKHVFHSGVPKPVLITTFIFVKYRLRSKSVIVCQSKCFLKTVKNENTEHLKHWNSNSGLNYIIRA